MKALFLLFLLLFLTTNVQATTWEKTNLQSTTIATLENSPYGLLAGEFDDRIWNNPFNGVYISKDMGQTWQQLGLAGHGIKDIKYFDGKIYAATYYVLNRTLGIFVSYDKGLTWQQIGPKVSPRFIERDSQTIYFGTENSGLWISKDEGQTWTQKFGDGTYGPNIKEIESSEDVTISTTTDKTYKSTDHGETWQEIPFLSPKGIEKCNINKNVILCGTGYSVGMFISYDFGENWEKLDEYGNVATGEVTLFNGTYFAGRHDFSTPEYSVYRSSDLGETWKNIGIHLNRIMDLELVFSSPSYLFATILSNGVYRFSLEDNKIQTFPFLDIPWNFSSKNELTDKITSFFDHSYPLLGYTYFKEKSEESSTTTNFLGYKGDDIFYSSHSGIDYALSYGTEIKAAASGLAKYYYCTDCGNTIKIDHLNGYTSIYMHLQNEGLITKDTVAGISVEKGQTIGKVGMTGKTTGPHLHFEIQKTNTTFPSNRLDPYGWQNMEKDDPWEVYAWADSLGTHSGSESLYLWNIPSAKNSILVENTGSLSLENKNLNLSTDLRPLTFFIQNYAPPNVTYLTYVPETSMLLEAYDLMRNKVDKLGKTQEIKIGFDISNLKNIVTESLKIYFFDEINKMWTALPTILDLTQNTVTSETDHFSWFAVMGTKIDSSPPETFLITSIETVTDGWYKNYPTISFSVSESNPNKIFYSIDYNENNWNEYNEPFVLKKDGIIKLSFRSQDAFENIEKTQTVVLKVDTSGISKRRIILKNTAFKVL